MLLLLFLWSGFLPVLKFPSLFQAVCSGALISLVFLERVAPSSSHSLQFLSLGLLFVHKSSGPFRAGLLLALKFCSLFRTVCSLFSYSFRVFRLCKLVRTGLLLVLRILQFLSSRLLFVLGFSILRGGLLKRL